MHYSQSHNPPTSYEASQTSVFEAHKWVETKHKPTRTPQSYKPTRPKQKQTQWHSVPRRYWHMVRIFWRWWRIRFCEQVPPKTMVEVWKLRTGTPCQAHVCILAVRMKNHPLSPQGIEAVEGHTCCYIQVTDQISNMLSFSISLHSIFHMVDMTFCKFFLGWDTFCNWYNNKMVLVIHVSNL